MRALASEVRARLRALFRRRRLERDMDEEFRFHLDMETEKYIREGMEPGEARRRARLTFGRVERHKERARETWGMRWLEDALGDFRFAARHLRKHRGFTAVAVVTLALGIGANSAVFGVVKAVLLDPLPYPDADELVMIHNQRVGREWSIHPWTPDGVFAEMARSASFDGVAGYAPQSFAVSDGDRPYELDGSRVTPGFFRVLRARVALGRDFAEADARPGAHRTVIISHDVWQSRFGGAPDIIGRTIRAAAIGWPHLPGDGELREVVGVLEPGFRLLAPLAGDPGIWVPYEVENLVVTVARLADGVTLGQAQAELDVVVGRSGDRWPETHFDFRWTPLKAEVVGGDRTGLLILQGAVAGVLLIACVNLANLLLARYGSRRTEVAIRAALGASRARLVRQTLTESALLSLLGGAAAVGVMALVVEFLPVVAPADIPRIDRVSVDGVSILYTLGMSLAVGLLVGIAAAAVAHRRRTGGLLQGTVRGATGSRRTMRAGRALVVGQVSVVLMLLVGAGLLVRTFLSLTSQDPGFRTEGVVTASLHVPLDRYETADGLGEFYRGVLERLEGTPGIESVALGRRVPLDRGSTTTYRVEEEPEAEPRSVQYEVVSEDYFRTLSIPLLRGRLFEETDRSGSPRVAIIDEAMWRAAWPGRDPIGRRLHLGEEGESWTVVGVVGSVRGSGLAHAPRPGVHLPLRQALETEDTRAVVLARSRLSVDDLAQPMREAVWAVDPGQPVPEITTLERIVAASVGPQRFRALLLASMAVIALLLTIAGIYGVVAQLATLRRREIGIRIAIGARSRDVLCLVIGQGAALAGIGVGLGLVATLGLTRVLEALLAVGGAELRQSAFNPQPPALLYSVSPTDPAILAGVALLLGAVAVLASYVPARRAASVDPMVTLSAE